MEATRSTFRGPVLLGALCLLGLLEALPARAGLIACQPVLATPCLVANNSGPYTIADPSQLTFLIVQGTTLYGTDGSDNATYYLGAGGVQLAADPTAVLAQNQASVTYLLNSGATSNPGSGATNPGGSVVVTNSTTSFVTGAFVDTPFTQRVDQYQTTIQAILNGTNQVYQQTFSAPYSDPTVQAAIAQADLILSGDGAGFGSPQLIQNNTSQTGGQTSYVTTGQSTTGDYLVSTIDTFGPAYVAVGDNQAQLFTVLAGQLDINVNTEIFYATDRNATATNTFLTTQTYEIDGSSGSSVPEPATWLLVGLGLCVTRGFATRRR